MTPGDRHRIIEMILKRMGISAPFEMLPCATGGNNSVQRVLVDGQVFAAKWYVTDPGGHNRLAAEWNFLQLTSAAGIVGVPRPVARDAHEGVALYTFVEGSAPDSERVMPQVVDAAIALVRALNRPGPRRNAGELGMAAEACFSADAHIQLVRDRVQRLAIVSSSAGSPPDVATIVADLRDVLSSCEAKVAAELPTLDFSLTSSLDPGARVISPSDFGLHNVIVDRDGEIIFIDFEYSGWDDPAKLWADFFFQPQVPVPDSYARLFLEATLSHLEAGCRVSHAARSRLLRPIFGIKWVCIILNPFLPGWLERRMPRAKVAEIDAVRMERAQRADRALQSLVAASGLN